MQQRKGQELTLRKCVFVVFMLLSVWITGCAQTTSIGLHIPKGDIDSIDIFFYDVIEEAKKDHKYISFTTAPAIAEFVASFETAYLREIPVSRLSDEDQYLLAIDAKGMIVEINYADGSIFSFFFGEMPYLVAEGRWYYATTGEQYGYEPFFDYWTSIYNRFENIAN